MFIKETNFSQKELSSVTAELVSPELIAKTRMLAVDAIEHAKSGHPGAVLSLIPAATLLFQEHLKFDPADPNWQGRDRFVLSCGHASMLLYTQLFLSGFRITIDDIYKFRSLGSNTPGHPEFHVTPGVEATTGPLGQGLAMAVGMAMGFKHEKELFDPKNSAKRSPFGQHVWVLASDGDLQEGISYEACSIAGRMKLDNLTVIYDDNQIQIDGSTSLTTAEDTQMRFEAQGWSIQSVDRLPSGEVDLDSLHEALKREEDNRKPRLIILKSEIAFPAPHARGTAASHGSPLGENEVDALRQFLGLTSIPQSDDPIFLSQRSLLTLRGQRAHEEWNRLFEKWKGNHPDLAIELGKGPIRKITDAENDRPSYQPGSFVSTRDASGAAIQWIADHIPGFWGGSADLSGPNRSDIHSGGTFLPSETNMGTYTGRNIHWGVREHAMAAATNGIALATHSPIFSSTFFVFSDYQRPAIRLAALMQLPLRFVWTHDSIAVGQDGPTHQPIEQLASLRAMPGFSVVRPADGNETVAAWEATLQYPGPTGLVLARQPVPSLDLSRETIRAGVLHGGYIVYDRPGARVVLVATGSEVSMALAAATEAEKLRIPIRVVSMPCREWFLQQTLDYRNNIIPPEATKLIIEAGSTFGWRDIAGPSGIVLGIDEFGISAPAANVQEAFGITPSNVLRIIRKVAES